jgi:5-methyltetrahydropteroyltriglutamate--homocysteine methyltransferase
MAALIDDVGSFPLPADIDGKVFEETYCTARKAIIDGKRDERDQHLLDSFTQVVVGSFMKKASAGLDIINYPQHYDMHRQLADILRESMDKGTYVIDQKRALLPEVHVISSEAKRLCEVTGRKIQLRVCVMGPIELYLREIGSVVHEDILQIFAENVRRFARNSILDSKYVKTVTVSLDEPSFGFQDISAEKETVQGTFEKAFSFDGATRQIHLHSPSKVADLLTVRNIDVLSIEYAASPKNIDSVSKGMLDQADKKIRVGVSRTDVDSIIAELYDKGITKPSAEQFVENERTIQKRFETAKAKYGDAMAFTGPDCGLGGWPTQEAAQLLLARTVKAVKAVRESHDLLV